MCIAYPRRCEEFDGTYFYKFFYGHKVNGANRLFTVNRTSDDYAIKPQVGIRIICDNMSTAFTWEEEPARFGIISMANPNEIGDWVIQFHNPIVYVVKAHVVYKGGLFRIGESLSSKYQIGYECEEFEFVEEIAYVPS